MGVVQMPREVRNDLDLECDCDIDCFGKVKFKGKAKAKKDSVQTSDDVKEKPKDKKD